MRLLCFNRFDLILRGCECISDLILRSRAFLRGVSKDGGRLRALRPSFETLAEPVIGPRFARTRWQALQDEGGDEGGDKQQGPPCRELLRAARKQNLGSRLRQNNPTGKTPQNPVQPLAQKYSA